MYSKFISPHVWEAKVQSQARQTIAVELCEESNERENGEDGHEYPSLDL